MQILVAYTTRKGSTGEIASAIGKELEGEGPQVREWAKSLPGLFGAWNAE